MLTEPFAVCKGCGQTILTGTVVQALNSDWHPKCFRCSACDRRLDNWYIQNKGRLYCRRDYLAEFKDACNGCSEVISGPVMVAGEHRFHPECFQCCLCQAFIGDGESYALVERSFLYCGTCYHKKAERAPIKPLLGSPEASCSPERYATGNAINSTPDPSPLPRPLDTQVTSSSSVVSTSHLTSVAPAVSVAPLTSALWPDSKPEGLEVGDRILEVNGDTIKNKTLEEVSNLLTDSINPVTVTLERDLSPLRLPREELEEPISPIPTSLLRGGETEERVESGQSGDSSAETVVVNDMVVRMRPKNSLRAKGPSRRRSKSPSPCPTSRQKSLDLSRSHSFTTHDQTHRVFRATDLVLGEVLGQGFFGQAIKVVHRVTGEIMVLKELHNFDENAQKSFLREVSMLRNVSHPCVLRFMGVLYRDKKLNLVTEFIDGGTLSALLLDHSRELSWKQRVAFAKDIANGMNYLHSIDIIHRDLNSQNCLVRKDQTVVVADFGLAKICPRHECLDQLLSNSPKLTNSGEDTLTTIGEGIPQTGSANAAAGGRTPRGAMKKKRFSRRKRQTVVGNPYWMAPEMMTKGVYDEKVDVFSFGIILCETIARVTADPDYLPRSLDFGLNVEAFHRKFCQDMPEPYFMLAVLCSQMEPDQRPSFDKIYMLCEALLLHVEHKVAVPFELQGSTVQFYRQFRVETYGTDYRDIDSCSQADSSAQQGKQADVSRRKFSENQLKGKVLHNQEKDTNEMEDPCFSQGEERIILKGGIRGEDTGHPSTSTSQVSGSGTCEQRKAEGPCNDIQSYTLSKQTLDPGIGVTDVGSVLAYECSSNNLQANNHSMNGHRSICAVETLNESKERLVLEDKNVSALRAACLTVTTSGHEDQAYFSCPSSSPPASPSSVCQFSSCRESPDSEGPRVCHSKDVDPNSANPACNLYASPKQTSTLRPKSVSLLGNVTNSGLQAQLHKATSLSLSNVAPVSHNSSDSELNRALPNGSMESGIFAECTPSDS
ncbi:hypothetical protein EGW08_020132 [Elysia chlorotica]|uniref:non-specific serine/threonine protein kinase n=1 Tax=Elysia chlorotica TaxID=188477 RepID=A0A3S0Z907_ELYCH|nr:hypothetical protein EGW08_020132 [Elysia chlorotica]